MRVIGAAIAAVAIIAVGVAVYLGGPPSVPQPAGGQSVQQMLSTSAAGQPEAVAGLTSLRQAAQTPVQGAIRGIQVTGTGTVRARPDMAVVVVGVQTRAQTAQEAQNQNNQQMASIIDAIKAAGIPEQNIQTTGINLHPVMERDQQITGYQATNLVRVRVTDIARVGEVLDAAVRAGANQTGGVQFGISNDDALRQQALGEAVQNARAKADAIARALGVTITVAEAVVEEGPGGPITPEMAPRPMAAAAEVPVEPGELAINAQVRVIYGYQ